MSVQKLFQKDYEGDKGFRAMAKQKRKRTAAEKAAKKQRRLEYMTVFMNGKQKRVKRPPTIDGMDRG